MGRDGGCAADLRAVGEPKLTRPQLRGDGQIERATAVRAHRAEVLLARPGLGHQRAVVDLRIGDRGPAAIGEVPSDRDHAAVLRLDVWLVVLIERDRQLWTTSAGGTRAWILARDDAVGKSATIRRAIAARRRWGRGSFRRV